jgi:hypothetical protein
MSTALVTAAMVNAADTSGSVRAYYRGACLAPETDPVDVDRLVALGFVEVVGDQTAPIDLEVSA